LQKELAKLKEAQVERARAKQVTFKPESDRSIVEEIVDKDEQKRSEEDDEEDDFKG